MALIISISGIRGTVGGRPGENLTPVEVVEFTSAYAGWIAPLGEPCADRPVVVVGRDARVSGALVSSLVCQTLMACGVDVVDLGLATTPTVEMAVPRVGARGGIIVTASHNPREWNALKLLNANGEFISNAEGKALEAAIARRDFRYAPYDRLGRRTEADFAQRHIDAVLALPLVDAEAIRRRGFKVVLDAVNSVGAISIAPMLERLGVECVTLNGTPDGLFAHDPEPLEKNLGVAMRAVAEAGADLGIVVDPDVDRLAFIDERGQMFGEEYTLVAVADYVLGREPGPTVSNLSSTRALRDVTRGYGQPYTASAVGEVNVVEAMKRTGAVIGGEGNGGVIYPALHYGRDALVGTALFLSHLARLGGTASELKSRYPLYHMAKEKIALSPSTDIARIAQALAARFPDAQIDTTDGVKVDLPGSWVHLRKSNTEPIMRAYAEAPDAAEARDLIDLVSQTVAQDCQ